MRFRRIGADLRQVGALPPPGVHLYTLREELQTDAKATLRETSEMGYRLAEPFMGDDTDLSAEQLRKLLDDAGLRGVSVFIDPLATDRLERQFQDARTLGVRYVVASLPEESFSTEKRYRESIALLREYSRAAARRGMILLYHPHNWELEDREGGRMIDRLLKDIGTDRMKLALDTYWIKKAGHDPYEILLAYKGLSPILHVKDINEAGHFAEIGRGTIDWLPIFSSFKELGIHYYFVEQDESPNPLESLRISLEEIKTLSRSGTGE